MATGFGLLKGKQGIVLGAMDPSSIGWQIALAAHREGARLALSNVSVALRIGQLNDLSAACGDAPIYPCDASNNEEIETLFTRLKEEFGPLDFLVHSIGMSQNIRKGLDYGSLNYDWYLKTLDVSAISLHRLVSAGLRHDMLRENGSILGMSYIAAQRVYTTYSDMGDAKALLEGIVRSFGPTLAKRGIRINSVSQSPTVTRAGSGIPDFDDMFAMADHISPLGNASAEECADYVVTLLSDLTRKVTMQNLYHDGGYSSMGTTIPVLRLFSQALGSEEMRDRAGAELRGGEGE